MDEKMIKIFASVESESGLKAFEMWMELQWFHTYMEYGIKFVVTIGLIAALCYGLYRLSKAEKETE
jgi:hypothetical protein